jgi:hypothetical protein
MSVLRSAMHVAHGSCHSRESLHEFIPGFMPRPLLRSCSQVRLLFTFLIGCSLVSAPGQLDKGLSARQQHYIFLICRFEVHSIRPMSISQRLGPSGWLAPMIDS